MPDNKPNNSAPEDVADYSGYFKKDEPVQVEAPTTPTSPLQELPVYKKFTKRAKILLIILVALILGQIYLMVSWSKNTTSAIPDGYRLVTPPNQPPYVEKIK